MRYDHCDLCGRRVYPDEECGYDDGLLCSRCLAGENIDFEAVERDIKRRFADYDDGIIRDDDH